MAPAKRTRRLGEAETDDGLDLQSDGDSDASHRSELSRNKRQRISVHHDLDVPQPSPKDHDTDSSSEGDVDDDSDGPPSPPQTQYELMRDAGFKHLQDTEKDDLEAARRLKQRPAKVGNNMAAEGGIIESITCFNFMCHERLHVELGPLLNFIVGENGSGKSAVLTALTLCLGGKASDTNRGGSLKSFVKEGQEHGRLLVKIKNAGPDAYQPHIYGRSILVERHFSRVGGSGFKIKNEQERVISTKKQEVDEISEWYALQMGNPLIVLSQDNARQFLNAATPAQKYKYFVSGVQLEQLDNDYRLSSDTLDKTLLLQDDLRAKIEDVRKELEDANRLAETVSKNNSLREKMRHYRSQLVWAQVVERERELQQQEQALEERKGRLDELKAEREAMTQELDRVQERLEQSEAARESLNGEQSTVEDSIDRAEEEWNTAKKELTALIHEERDAHGRLKTAKDDIEDCEAKIDAERQKLSESAGSARSNLEAQQKDALAREADLTRQMDTCMQQLPNTQANVADAEKKVKEHRDLKDQKQKEIKEAERHVQELQKNTRSRYDGFDRDIVQLVKMVAEHSGFENRPVGPLGAHIKLSKPEWSGVLEKTLGDALNAFVVRSKKDQSVLRELIRRLNPERPPPVYIAYGSHIDTRNQEPSAEFETILRVLEFDDDLVRSQLVINNQIEKIILVKDRVEAEAIMVDNGPPRNVTACICFHDGKGKRGQGLRMTNRAGTIGTSPVVPSRMRPRMQSDSVRQLTLQRDNLKQLLLELKELQAEERQAQQALQKVKSQQNEQTENIRKMENELRRTRADLERIAVELDSFEGVDTRLETLNSELKERRAEESQLGIQYGLMRVAKRKLSDKAEAAKKKLTAIKDERRDFSARVDKADSKVKRCESLRRIAVSKKNQAYERVDTEKRELEHAEKKCAEKQTEIKDLTRQAEALYPSRVHIPDGEDHRSIERKYVKIGEQLAQREARIGASDEQIYNRASDARVKYDDFMRQTADVDETIKSLKYAIARRLHLWREFQARISSRIRTQFSLLMTERGYRGNLDFDHPHRRVNIRVEPDDTKRSSAGRNTTTLSGGEKSFSSVCMLLSIWEAIGSPICCLDEFDVFMDNVNRAVSTNMLIDTARRAVSRQYILITPNAIEGRANLDKDVKIIRLTDPRQRTLL